MHPDMISVEDLLEEVGGHELADEDGRFRTLFERLNLQHFKGCLVSPRFVASAHRGHYAWYSPDLHVLSFHPRLLAQEHPMWVEGSMLHEMVHILLTSRDQDTDQNHGKHFVVEANRIGRSYGMRAVAPGSDAAIVWPHESMKKPLRWE